VEYLCNFILYTDVRTVFVAFRVLLVYADNETIVACIAELLTILID